MRILSDLDGDEVSLVRRAANKRRYLLLKGDSGLDTELADILDIPWEREGALLDEIRKEGIQDDTVERAVVAAVRLLKGVETEFTPELIEKVGRELYGVSNPKLNTGSGTGSGGGLSGSARSADDHFGNGGTDEDLDGDGKGSDLKGSGSGAKVAEQEPDDDDDDDDVKKADEDGARSFLARCADALGVTNLFSESREVSKSNSSDIEDVMSTHENGGDAVEFRVPVKKEDGTWDYAGVPDEARDFFSAMIEKADRTEEELKSAREQIAKAAEDKLTRDSVEKAAGFSHVAPTDDLAPILKEASAKLDPETVEKLESILGNAQERITKGDLFTEMGARTSVNVEKSDAYSEAVQKAAELVEKSDTSLTQEQALARVFDANPDLYNKYLVENGMGVQ